MKKVYSLFIALSIFFLGCSKDILKSYDERIEGGTWELTDVDRVGIGGSTGHLPFRDGRFVFYDGGKLEYTNNAGELYDGSWDIRKHRVQGNCNTDNNGNRQCDDKTIRSLQITGVNFTSREVRSEYFDEIVFTGTNRFKAYIYSGARTYVFTFKR